MRRLAAAGAIAAGLAACGPQQADTAAPLAVAEQNALLDEYCLSCHNFDDYAGGLELVVFDPALAHEDVEIGEAVIRKLRAGMMPPAGEPRPDFDTLQAFAASLEANIDAEADPRPLWHGLHRLNRAEYANAVRDLIGLEVDASAFLPVDDSSNGFDNQAGALGLSPALLEAYLSAAGELSRLAIGNVSGPSQTVFRVAEDATQNYHIEGLPFGTRGGTLIRHIFPVDGDYAIKIFPVNVGNMGNFRPFGGVPGEQLEVLLDGERVALFDWDEEFSNGFSGQLPSIDLTIPVTAGLHDVGVTFLASNYAPVLDLNNDFERATIETGGIPGFTFYPHIGTVRIDGPYNPRGVSDTLSRELIFSCQPNHAAEERACAEEIVGRLAHRAYRGLGTDADVASLMGFYDAARETGDFEDGVEAALQRVLSDPKFLFRVETAPNDAAPGDVYLVSDVELASRLSFFLWSSIPDDELLDLAVTGRLSEPAVYEAQVQRMLDDPRSEALTANFAGQWLALRNLDGHVPIVMEFPDFDDNLRQAFRRETELLFDSLIREDRSVFELLTADYTFVNERLAKHYGIPGVRGSRFRRVELGEEFAARRGLLGKGSILTVSSQPGRTSPVIRGNWVLGNLIGVPPPPPPPDVPDIEPPETDAAGNVRPPTMREQFESHRNDPACSGCHLMMDPIGFALEPFDATGRWRTEDAGSPINAADVMYDGTPVNGPEDLRGFLLKYDNRFATTVVEKLMTYALGRGVEHEDMPMVRAVVREAGEDHYRFRSVVLAVATSDAFTMSTRPMADDLDGGEAGSTARADPSETSRSAGDR